MKILIAPNAFKGCLSAAQAAQAMREGVLEALPDAETVLLGVADGGDGLVDVLAEGSGGQLHRVKVRGPLGYVVLAEYLYFEETATAIIEMARASGLALIPAGDQDVMSASTFGTGELILHALDSGAKRIVLGLGGSATCDGGAGMAAALGGRFLDRNGETLLPSGATLAQIAMYDGKDLDPRLQDVEVTGVCDVENPLLGPDGAAAVYAPQKGATPAQVPILEDGLRTLAESMMPSTGTDIRDIPGTGAAGGLGAGVLWFLGGTLRPGVDVVLDLLGIDSLFTGADLVLTAEGRIDAQTAFGKAPTGVSRRAMARGIPCFALAGSVADDISSLHNLGIDAVFSICNAPLTLDEAMIEGARLLRHATCEVVRAFHAGFQRRT